MVFLRGAFVFEKTCVLINRGLGSNAPLMLYFRGLENPKNGKEHMQNVNENKNFKIAITI